MAIFQAELESLKNYQTTLGLDEPVAAQELAAVTRQRAEAHVQAAYEKIRVLRSRGGTAAVDELKNLLAYNRHMVYKEGWGGGGGGGETKKNFHGPRLL